MLYEHKKTPRLARCLYGVMIGYDHATAYGSSQNTATIAVQSFGPGLRWEQLKILRIQHDHMLRTRIVIKVDRTHPASHLLHRSDLAMIANARQVNPNTLAIAYIFQIHKPCSINDRRFMLHRVGQNNCGDRWLRERQVTLDKALHLLASGA
jgi:hypothetical protein